ncbi:MAG: wax ester/triacylglycerol synthase family O-acyltransferase [bacterium]|nr:wax ester/triacylglycerol synthase family O-acyltransferase [bacterium]
MVAFHERLSAQDRVFLHFEEGPAHMHLGGLTLFEPGTLATPDGGIDVGRIRAHIASRLHLVPRYRQRLSWIPVVGRPVWVDDEHFDLSYHVRHTAVPRPGDDAQLKLLAGRIFSQQLDRGKPLWEIWVIEGLADGRFALLVKTHHALADGISAFDLFAALLTPEPQEHVDSPQPWRARPAPSGLVLLRDELRETARSPITLAATLLRSLRDPAALRDELMAPLRALWALVETTARPLGANPLNRPIGPHRRFDWHVQDLETVRAIRSALGGTVNDVALTVVAGAMRRLLAARGAAPDRIDFRVVVPVSVRAEDEQGVINNRVSGWMVPLPVGEPDARRRHAAVRETTARLKAVRMELGAELLGRAAEHAVPGVLGLGVRLTARLSPYNLIVTNVPGPPIPLWLLGARLCAGFPQVPLFEHQALGIALFSYDGQLCWGINTDWDGVSDPGEVVEALRRASAELCGAAGVREADAAASAVG